jgi:hypothetical protein
LPQSIPRTGGPAGVGDGVAEESGKAGGDDTGIVGVAVEGAHPPTTTTRVRIRPARRRGDVTTMTRC